MEKHEVPYGGVYRLTVDGQLAGEFLPGPLWSELYEAAVAKHLNVSYSWAPLSSEDAVDEVQRLRAALELAREGLAAAEDHLPSGVGLLGKGWILCSCGDDVRSSYWTRHSQGADGSVGAPSKLDALNELLA